MFKNTAAKFMVFAFDTTNNTAKTGDAANITCYVSKDYGTVTVLADTSATEMDATNAKGYYLFDAAQGETNGDCLMISAKSTTANIAVIGAPAVIYTRPTTNWLAPTTLNRTLDVSAGGEAGVDWANVGSPTTSNALTGTTIAVTQKVDVDTIKTNPVVNAGTVTFPTTATLASTSNITAATGVDITKILGTAISTPATAGILDVNLKNIANAAVSASTAQLGVNLVNWKGSAAATVDSAGYPVVTIKDGTGQGEISTTSGKVDGVVLTDTLTTYTGNTVQTGDSYARIGVAGAGLTNIDLPNQTMDIIGNITGNLSGSVGSVAGLTASNLDVTVSSRLASASYTAPDNTSVTAIKTQTDKLTFTVANQLDSNIQYVNDVQVTGNGSSGTPWGP